MYVCMHVCYDELNANFVCIKFLCMNVCMYVCKYVQYTECMYDCCVTDGVVVSNGVFKFRFLHEKDMRYIQLPNLILK